MKTVLDNSQRVFQIVTSTGRQIFCNLKDIRKYLYELEIREGYYTINHFWNNKPKKCSKKLLNEMFKANNIDVDNKIFTIDIEAKEWFDKINGNSYHAGSVTVNFGLESEQTLNFGFTYGYGEQYKQTAFKTLCDTNILPKLDFTKLYDYIKNNGIEVRASITMGCKKSELMEYK